MKSLPILFAATALAALTLGLTASAQAGDVDKALNSAGAVPAADGVIHPTNPMPPLGAADAPLPSPAADVDIPIDASDAANLKLSHDTAQAIFALEMHTRALQAQANELKAQADVAKTLAEIAKTQREAKTAAAPPPAANADRVSDGPSGATPDGAPSVNAIPHIAVRWIAGKDDALEAMVWSPKIGSVMVKAGSPFPMSANLTIKMVRHDGLIAVDPEGNLYPIGFGG
jgi:hypothetical protein